MDLLRLHDSMKSINTIVSLTDHLYYLHKVIRSEKIDEDISDYCQVIGLSDKISRHLALLAMIQYFNDYYNSLKIKMGSQFYEKIIKECVLDSCSYLADEQGP
jgi:hypothetical protein